MTEQERTQLGKLLRRYFIELDRIAGREQKPAAARQKQVDDFLADDTLTWNFVYKELDRVIGFMAVGTDPNCHPDCDFYIAETYVIPEERHNGYMRLLASDFITDNPGKYCMFILDRNERARVFWTQLFSSLGYEPMELRDVLEPDGYCTQYGWQLKQGK